MDIAEEMEERYRITKGLEPLESFRGPAQRIKLCHDDIIQETFEGLKPCPFCGGKNIYVDMCGSFLVHNGDGRYERLICYDCGIGQSPTPKQYPELMIRMWNTRTIKKGETMEKCKTCGAVDTKICTGDNEVCTNCGTPDDFEEIEDE